MTAHTFFYRGLVVASSLAALFLTACERRDVQVYTAPKDQPAPVNPAAAAAMPSMAARPRPEVTWTLPEGWKEAAPGRLSVAAFTVGGAGGREAQVSITPLPALAGREASIVNMWREQLGMPALPEADALKQLQAVEIAGESGKLFELSNRLEGATNVQAVVTAFVHRADASWFYRFTGDAEVVTAQKPTFLSFLKTVRVKEAAAPPAGTAAATDAAPETSGFRWQVPQGWKALAAGQMQVAKFAVPEKGAARAEVSVSIFPSDTGGMLGNVNRWRRQIGLPDITSAEMASSATPLDPKLPGAMLVDVTNAPKRLVGAIVPRGRRWFFYKLTGDAEAVAPEKDAFAAFARSEP